MPVQALTKQTLPYAAMSLIALVFFIPTSPSLKSICLITAILAILLTPACRQALPSALQQPWSLTGVMFFLLVIAGCFWSPASTHTQLIFIEKYSKLLWLPVLAVGFQDRRTRLAAIYAFLAAMMFSCVLMIFGIERGPRGGGLFHNYIVTSYMVAVAAYLSGWLAFEMPSWKKRLVLLSMLALFSYELMFINSGRSGYLIFFTLMVLLLIQYLPFKRMLIAVVCFTALFAVLGSQSPRLSHRIQKISADLNAFQHGKVNTAVGYRLIFHRHAKSLYLSHPVFGHGTGSFSYYLDKDLKLKNWKNLLDPHSQYWLIASEMGSIGLLAFTGFLLSLFIAARQLKEMKPILIGFIVAFLVGNLTDSLFFYSAIGYLFIVLNALCLGESIEIKRKQ